MQTPALLKPKTSLDEEFKAQAIAELERQMKRAEVMRGIQALARTQSFAQTVSK